MGLDMAGSVLGTADGLAGLQEAYNSRSLLRRTNQAFFNKIQGIGKAQADTTQGIGDTISKGLSNLRDAQGKMVNNLGDLFSQHLQNAGDAAQSVASSVADTGKAAVNGIQNAVASATSDENKIAGLKSQMDQGINNRIFSYPQASQKANILQEGNQINQDINAKAKSMLDPEEYKALNSKFPSGGNLKMPQELSEMPFNNEKVMGQKTLLNVKNNMVNDAITRKQMGLPQADAYDTSGNPIINEGSTAVDKASSTAITDTTKGISSVGDGASQTVASALDAIPLPHQGLGNIGNMTDLNPILGTAEDISSDAGRAAASSAADMGNSILARANSLKLMVGNIPTQNNGGIIQGLRTATGIDTNSGSANLLSQAHSLDATAHATAQSATNQVTRATDVASDAANTAATNGANAATDAANSAINTATSAASKVASAGAQTADDVGTGIKTALGIETTMDELAPETGPLAPILEAGSLLATLGTSIASLFEPSEKKSTPPPQAAPQTLSVGANLKSDATGSVGAF
jgi:trimeric autotransporter adhesin